MEHFSHEHPLILNEEPRHKDDDGKEVKCNGCLDLISGPFYSCEQCVYFLHHGCAELPRKMNHPMHPQHPLTLLAQPPYPLGEFDCICDACNRSCESFVYHCSLCDFILDLLCASMAHKIEHKYHPQHPLIPLQQPALFLCHACGTEHKGLSYKCSSCTFWVQQNCALLPSTIKHGHHDHFLSLTHSLPDEYSTFDISCDICEKTVNAMYWVYYCAGCRYYAHLNCATTTRESLVADEKTGTEDGVGVVVDPNPILLPVPNESINLITHLVKIITAELEEKNIATTLDHFGHEHPLILSDELNYDELCLNEVKNSKLCEACVQPISSPFYSCTQCNYFVHKCCAELPIQIRHPYHPEHPLDLLAKPPEDHGLIWCAFCQKPCNGFAFRCGQCKNVYLDVKCACFSAGGAIKHEGHKHLLRLSGQALVCDICNFTLASGSAMLPPAVNHRYDKHPWILNYYPIKDHLAEYYCEICEGEVNPKAWFYHCGYCDQSAHPSCIQKYLLDSNIKYGASIKVEGHPHLLTFVRFNRVNHSRCSHCGRHLNGYYAPGLECAPCKLKLHLECARSLPNKEIL